MCVSVVIPTYNGAKRLSLVLDKLKAQEGCENISWEVLVADNNSTDNTREVFKERRESWDLPDVPLRYHLEERQGAAFARARGIREAQGEVVAFLDDDCIPENNWLFEVYRFGKEHPDAGAWGSRVIPGENVVIPEHLSHLKRQLAIEDRGGQPERYEPEKLILPPTAALAVRRKVWAENASQKQVLRGRSKGFPAQGDDYEPLLYIYKAGWEIWYNPGMVVQHNFDPDRLEPQHLKYICFANGLATYSLKAIITPGIKKIVYFFKLEIGSILRILRHLWKFKLQLFRNVGAYSELRFHIGMLFSPYFYLVLLFRRWFSNKERVKSKK